MLIKDVWLINKEFNKGKVLFTLSDLISLIRETLESLADSTKTIDIKYLHSNKEGWMAVIHFG
jgi:hypothetical protein